MIGEARRLQHTFPLRKPGRLGVAVIAIWFLAFAATCSEQPDFDLIVSGGTVYDGTGELSGVRRTDVGITGDRIRAIGDLSARRAPVVIDASGKAVAPGFIDVQSRSGVTLLANGLGESHLRQGITSEILADGRPPLWSASTADRPALQRYNVQLDWAGLPGYFTKLESRGTAINVGTLIPLSLARASAEREAFIDGAMRNGAFGIVDDVDATEEEVAAAAANVGRHGGVVMVHANGDVAASDDAVVTIGSLARGLVIADISRAPANHPASELVARMVRAVSRKVNAVGTVTPYPAAPGEPDTAVREALKFGGTLIVTDSSAMKDSSAPPDVHPAAFGAFPRLLSLARDGKVIELREAVRRATSAPASVYDIQERGIVRENYFADLVVFDPQTISDRATFEKPNQYPAGIEYVIVNGVVELTPRGVTGSRAGSRLVRRPATR